MKKTALWIGGGLLAAAVLLPSVARALSPAPAPAAPYQPPQPGGGRLAEAQGWTSFAFSLLDSLLGIGKGIFDWAGGSGGGSWGGSGGADINEDPSDAFLGEGNWKNE